MAIRSILLGVGLAMDAFSVSLADGLGEQKMGRNRMLLIAGTFAVFQFMMPMIGWVLVRTAVEKFNTLEMYIPWIALILLLYIGDKMLIEGIREKRGKNDEDTEADDTVEKNPADTPEVLTYGALFIQGIATSIDALSVGFTIEQYALIEATLSSLIIGAVTLFICLVGLALGKKLGTKLSGSASIIGGTILVAIGLEIWAKGVFL